jgi:hypothetical protein
MGTCTFTNYTSWGTSQGHIVVAGGITPSTSYAMGTGDNFTPAACGVNGITMVYPTPANGYVPVWDNSVGSLKVYAISNGAQTNAYRMIEAQATTNFANVTFPALVIGKVQI